MVGPGFPAVSRRLQLPRPGSLEKLQIKCPVVQPETSELFEMFEMSRLVA